MRAITSNGGKGMRIKHQSVKIQYSPSSQLTLYSSILIRSVCVGATRGMLLMDDLFGEIAFGTSLNLSNDQSSKQLIEAKKYNVPGITRILQAGSLLFLLCPAQRTPRRKTTLKVPYATAHGLSARRGQRTIGIGWNQALTGTDPALRIKSVVKEWMSRLSHMILV